MIDATLIGEGGYEKQVCQTFEMNTSDYLPHLSAFLQVWFPNKVSLEDLARVFLDALCRSYEAVKRREGAPLERPLEIVPIAPTDSSLSGVQFDIGQEGECLVRTSIEQTVTGLCIDTGGPECHISRADDQRLLEIISCWCHVFNQLDFALSQKRVIASSYQK